MSVPCTHSSLHVRNVQDAMIVFEAVRRGTLPLVERRLTAPERDALQSGNVFVWEEGEHKQGLERWTDGRRWSQSRLRNEFLYYDEKLPITQDEREMKAARRAEYNNGCSTKKPVFRRSDRPTKPNGLTKQTFSTLIRNTNGEGFKKWHIVAYFSMAYSQLPVIEDIDYLRCITLPKGIFMPSRGPGSSSRFEHSSSGSTSDDDSQPATPTNSCSPAGYSGYIPPHKHASPSFLALSGIPTSIELYHPGNSHVSHPVSPLSLSPPFKTRPSLSLESIPPFSRHALKSPAGHSYYPLTPEDVRALNSFPLRL